MKTTHPSVLGGAWELAATPPERLQRAEELGPAALSWLPATVPGTVAQALAAAGRWDFDHPQDFDSQDWWFRTRFRFEPHADAGRPRLRCEGLATIAEVWLNGVKVLDADNMFREYIVDVSDVVRPNNDLVLCFRALATTLARRRPRPRWKTKLVDQQQLRWVRTTLLGRIPGWSPPVAPVGPWRPITLEAARPGDLLEASLHPGLHGDSGRIAFDGIVAHERGASVSAELVVADRVFALAAVPASGGSRLTGGGDLSGIEPWWPHTHGRPARHASEARVVVNGVEHQHKLDPLGFRRISLDQENGDFGLRVNGARIFCRGACWTIGDIVTASSPPEVLRRDLGLLRDAGANMLRVSGTMTYEADAFYNLCDELGLLVWQDFMFANMDYPMDDPAFRASVDAEIGDVVRRLRRHPSMAVYCGNSEIEQQAAMLGLDQPLWRNAFFADALPTLVASAHPDVPYVPSTPSGGDLPFRVGTGLAHYYGVGAYLRPLAEVRTAHVRFAPECLAFANVPDAKLVPEITNGQSAVTHDSRWKARTPRDSGAGWDFEDVRDHYLGTLFDCDPVQLRSTDPARYLELGRVTTGEVMARVFAQWRRAESVCHGGLVWFLKDLWPGAGWGILDSRGLPKACFYALRRVWQPQAVVLTDDGLDGLTVHVINEPDRPLHATLQLTLLRNGQTVVARAQADCAVPARSTTALSAEALLGRFHDVTYVYRFGPPAHDVVAVSLVTPEGTRLSEAFWFRDPATTARQSAGAVVAEAWRIDARTYDLAITSERLLFGAHVDVPGFNPDDNYFCLMPADTTIVRLHALADPVPTFSGVVEALNLEGYVGIGLMCAPRVPTP